MGGRTDRPEPAVVPAGRPLYPLHATGTGAGLRGAGGLGSGRPGDPGAGARQPDGRGRRSALRGGYRAIPDRRRAGARRPRVDPPADRRQHRRHRLGAGLPARRRGQRTQVAAGSGSPRAAVPRGPGHHFPAPSRGVAGYPCAVHQSGRRRPRRSAAGARAAGRQRRAERPAAQRRHRPVKGRAGPGQYQGARTLGRADHRSAHRCRSFRRGGQSGDDPDHHPGCVDQCGNDREQPRPGRARHPSGHRARRPAR
ncbi:hypothetical protein D9M71_391920 [compost metagenome]